MPNFTNKVKLKKPLGTEYFNINDMNENMDKIEEEFYTPKYSENLLNEGVTSFKVGQGKVDGQLKDYTSDMEQTLVNIDNIQGKTVLVNNMFESVSLNTLANLGELVHSVDLTTPYTENCVDKTISNKSITITSNTSGGYSHVGYKINLEPYSEYIMIVDADNLSGTAYVETFLAYTDGTKNHSIRTSIKGDLGDRYEDTYTSAVSQIIGTNETGKLVLDAYCNAANNFQEQKTVRYNSIKFYKIKNYVSTDKQLHIRSIPNGIKDTFINNLVTKRVECVWINSGWDIRQGGDSDGYKQFYVSLPNLKIKDKYTSYDFDIANGSKNWAKKGTNEAQVYSGESVRLENNIFVFKINSAVDLVAFKNYLDSIGGVYVTYEASNYTTLYLTNYIIANHDDTMYIDTQLPVSCTHTIQLNTKSQVEELQEVVSKEKKSIWQKFKELTDAQILIAPNGYIKLPSWLGSFIIQWGAVGFTSSLIDYQVIYPIAFNDYVLVNLATVNGRNENWNAKVNFRSDSLTQGRLVVFDNIAGKENSVNWIAIGR